MRPITLRLDMALAARIRGESDKAIPILAVVIYSGFYLDVFQGMMVKIQSNQMLALLMQGR
ncbi:hypothetical protein LCR_14535 [Aeromonas enteropelogenes]|uniref:Uncharacterized protein n=1 Tax=Aeromonas enteropelogenes TaxID=29489 RepID=A0A175VHV5_AEREN|nr:hypothetical protein LCR_14535 [Aeromonas enteropelogenes]